MDLRINFVTENTTRKMNSTQKCDFIISKLKTEECVLVFEGGLNPEEEAALIEEAMTQIDHQEFLGYKILNPTPLRMSGIFSRKNIKMTVIAPHHYEHLQIALV